MYALWAASTVLKRPAVVRTQPPACSIRCLSSCRSGLCSADSTWTCTSCSGPDVPAAVLSPAGAADGPVYSAATLPAVAAAVSTPQPARRPHRMAYESPMLPTRRRCPHSSANTAVAPPARPSALARCRNAASMSATAVLSAVTIASSVWFCDLHHGMQVFIRRHDLLWEVYEQATRSG